MSGITGVVPTQGRASLERLLDSVYYQGLRPEDEYLVVVDTFQMENKVIDEIVDRVEDVYGPQFRTLLYGAGHCCWGHCQLNYALDKARPGNYITFNDDDDIYAFGAWDAIRREIATDQLHSVVGRPRCHIFKFRTSWRQILPEGPELVEGRVGGHCLVVPNVGKVGQLTCRYNGDWDLIASTVAQWGDDVVFHDDVIALARPTEEDYWWTP